MSTDTLDRPSSGSDPSKTHLPSISSDPITDTSGSDSSPPPGSGIITASKRASDSDS